MLSTSGLILLRRSLADAPLSAIAGDIRVLAGVVLYALSFGTVLLALRRFEVLTVFPVFLGAAYATTAVAARIYLGEQVTAMRAAGIVVVGIGLVLLAK